MKKVFVFVGMLMFTAVAVYAGTSGGIAPAVGKVNVPLTVPKPANAFCTTIGAGRATQATLDVSGTTMLSYQVKTADTATTAGTATVVKRKLATSTTTNTAYINASSESHLPIAANVKSVVLERYSSNTALSVCGDMN